MTVTVKKVQQSLPELIAGLQPGDELVITQNARPVAQLRRVGENLPQSQFGSCRGKLLIMAEDDDHLEAFQDYMP